MKKKKDMVKYGGKRVFKFSKGGSKIESLKINRGKYFDMEYNSQKIKEGDLFVALEGATVDGHQYIDDAIERGAKGIICSKKVIEKDGIEYYYVENLRERLGEIASEFYGYPQDKISIVGVTGTNGKTTITYLLEQILGEKNVARIGTVEYKIGEEIIEAPNTTPESLDIIKICKKIVEKGIKYLVMEVSSHALKLGRVNMLKFDVGIFSNLTPEHLDFHKNMEEYFFAKKELFHKVKKVVGKSNCVINLDDEYGKRYYSEFKGISYGIENGELKGEFIEKNLIKISYKHENRFYENELKLKLLGKYNLYNILGAIGGALSLGFSWDEIIKKVPELKGAPGRFEIVDCKQNFTAIVDYAHSSDALENLLKAVKELEFSKIITVFGCGGDRDRTKRVPMTEIALKFSDLVIVTSDNPRTENPQSIIDEMIAGIDMEKNRKKLFIEVDREEAIKKAVELCKDGEIIVVAGKGHETYQIIGRKKYHFDDREYLRREIIKKIQLNSCLLKSKI